MHDEETKIRYKETITAKMLTKTNRNWKKMKEIILETAKKLMQLNINKSPGYNEWHPLSIKKISKCNLPSFSNPFEQIALEIKHILCKLFADDC